MNSFISCSYKLGNSQILDNSWNWNNVLIPDNKLYIIEKGEIEITTDSEVLLVKAGEMVLIPALISHSLKVNNSNNFTKKTWIHFSMKNGSQDYFSNFKRPVKILLPNKNQALKIMKDVIRSDTLSEPNRSLLTSAGIFELVSIFLSECAPVNTPEIATDVDKAVTYINANFTEQLSLSALAEKFGCSPNHFIKKFKEQTGYTPIKYLAIKKVEAAKILLETTTLPISDIMERVGFYDASYFSKLFKKTVGYSPRGYRDNLIK